MIDLWKSDEDWFVTWFNTEAYHVLYDERDEWEAAAFMDRLHNRVLQTASLRILDLGCGAGRHAACLARNGHSVVGLDLSENSIHQARQTHRGLDHLSFRNGDMRNLIELFEAGSFDAVLSLFTSLGYFANEQDLLRTLAGVDSVLRPGGLFVLDFLNVPQVVENLVKEERIDKAGFCFQIHRRVHDEWIEKSIQFTSLEGQPHHHVERVRALSLSQWTSLFEAVGWNVLHAFGDYALNSWSVRSERCILVAQKLPCGQQR